MLDKLVLINNYHYLLNKPIFRSKLQHYYSRLRSKNWLADGLFSGFSAVIIRITFDSW